MAWALAAAVGRDWKQLADDHARSQRPRRGHRPRRGKGYGYKRKDD